ncbi:aminotransferase class V-fold PLP-dependent enzyme [candidate division KSB1 bacterium]|nr:aminotransferase class V-fold PLP-dependent enzyme [candidate division KSB1 bacterium]
MNRRNFIQAIGILAGGSLFKKTAAALAVPSELTEKLWASADEQTFWKIVREQFLLPSDYAYLNTGGIGTVPVPVLHKIRCSTNEQQAKPGPGYDHEQWLQIKEKCAGLIGPTCEKDEIALVSTATEGINIILNGLQLKKGDEVIASTHEHAALHVPLLHLMKRNGIRLRFFEPDFKNGLGNVDRIRKLINKRTKLIFTSHITCTTGQVFPIKAIGQIAKDNGLWFAVDGAQAIGTMPINITDCHVDFYTFSGHKWILGPKRTGVLYVRKDLQEMLQPLTVGAYSVDAIDIEKLTITYNPTAQKYEYGTENDALYHGLGAAIDFMNTIGLQKIESHNRALAEQFYLGLKQIKGVEVISPEQEDYRSSMITFKIAGTNFVEVGNSLTEKGMRVRAVPEVNLDGIRASFHIYNNEGEVERTLNKIQNIANL